MKTRTRTLPLTFHGELHGAELLQFSIDPEEARELAPAPLVPSIVGGRALVSCVNVELRGMRPSFMPAKLGGLRYRHIAFRLHVRPDAIFFVRSFTQHRLIALGGEWLTNYRLGVAHVRQAADGLEVEQGNRRFAYRRGSNGTPPGDLFPDLGEARRILQSLDRAYSVGRDGRVWFTRILRDRWPLEPLPVRDVENDFFRSSVLECAFRVPEPIGYVWQAPRILAGRG